MPDLCTFQLPTRVVFGHNALARLPDLLFQEAGGGTRVLLVVGRRHLERAGVLEKVVEGLGRERVVLFRGVPASPGPQQVEEAVALCRSEGCGAVVGIGGGSVLDVAKCAALLSAQGGPPLDYLARTRPLERPGLPLIAVPTTSGSSSEVTPYVSIWHGGDSLRFSLSHPWLYPRVALVDPVLALSMPSSVVASSGMDALASALESCWAPSSWEATEALALEAVRLFRQNLELSFASAEPRARSACALAATLSGMAYSNTGVSICHAVSIGLTARFGTTHGVAVGITLPLFLERHLPLLPPCRRARLLAALGVSTEGEAVLWAEGLLARLGLPTRLGQLGVAEGDLAFLVDTALAQPMASNVPRPLTRGEALDLLGRLL